MSVLKKEKLLTFIREQKEDELLECLLTVFEMALFNDNQVEDNERLALYKLWYLIKILSGPEQ